MANDELTILATLQDKLSGALKSINDELGKTGKTTEDTGKKGDAAFAGFGASLRKARDSVLSLKGALVALGVLKVIAVFRSFVTEGAALADTAKRLAVSAKDISAFRFAFDQLGASAPDADAALSRLNRTLGDLQRGTNAEAAKAIQALGLSVGEFAQLPVDEAMLRLADGISSIADQSERASILQDVFGRGLADQVLPALQDGSAELRKFIDRAKELGLVISDKDAKAFDELDDSTKELVGSISALGREFSLVFVPAINNLVQGITDAISGIRRLVTEALDAGRDIKALPQFPGGVLAGNQDQVEAERQQRALEDVKRSLAAIGRLTPEQLAALDAEAAKRFASIRGEAKKTSEESEREANRLAAAWAQAAKQMQAAFEDTGSKVRATEIGRVEELADRARAALDRLIRAREQNAQLLEQGFITSEESVARDQMALASFTPLLAELQTKASALGTGVGDELNKLLEKLAEIRAMMASLNVPEGTFLSGLQGSLRQTAEQFDTLRQVGQFAGDAIGEGFDGVFRVLTTGQGTLREFTSAFLLEIGRMISKTLLFKAILASLGIFGGASGIAGGEADAILASGGIGRATGGPVPGPRIDRDVVPARLTPGEWVIRRQASEHYGATIMSAINRGLIPRDILARLVPGGSTINLGRSLAGGGAVSPTFAGGGGAGSATLVADEQTMERLLSGGAAALRRFMRDNRDALGLGNPGVR